MLPFMKYNRGTIPGKTFNNVMSTEAGHSKPTEFGGQQTSLQCSMGKEKNQEGQNMLPFTKCSGKNIPVTSFNNVISAESVHSKTTQFGAQPPNLGLQCSIPGKSFSNMMSRESMQSDATDFGTQHSNLQSSMDKDKDLEGQLLPFMKGTRGAIPGKIFNNMMPVESTQSDATEFGSQHSNLQSSMNTVKGPDEQILPFMKGTRAGKNFNNMMPRESIQGDVTEFGGQQSNIQPSMTKGKSQDGQMLPFMKGTRGAMPGKSFNNMIPVEGVQSKGTQFDGELASLQCTSSNENTQDKQQPGGERASRDNAQSMSSQCPICNEWCDASNLIPHIKSHKRSFECPYCHRTSATRKELHKHMQIHSVPRRVYHCPQCKKPWLNAQSLMTHMASHQPSDEHHCADCPKPEKPSKRKNTASKRRPQKPSENGRYSCTLCDKSYTANDTLRFHMRTKHNDDPLKFPCEQCGKNFGNATSLKYHMNGHTGITPYVCNICGSKFSKPGQLRWHKFSHDDEGTKTYQCLKCPKKYRALSELKNHAVVHSTVKRFQCSHCHKNYKTAGSLKNHEILHSGVLKECPICKKTFKSPTYLNSHMKFHDKDREYGCADCGEKFSTKSSLRKHSKIHMDVDEPAESPEKGAKPGAPKNKQKVGKPATSWTYPSSTLGRSLAEQHHFLAFLDKITTFPAT